MNSQVHDNVCGSCKIVSIYHKNEKDNTLKRPSLKDKHPFIKEKQM